MRKQVLRSIVIIIIIIIRVRSMSLYVYIYMEVSLCCVVFGTTSVRDIQIYTVLYA